MTDKQIDEYNQKQIPKTVKKMIKSFKQNFSPLVDVTGFCDECSKYDYRPSPRDGKIMNWLTTEATKLYEEAVKGEVTENTSDGCHTFKELYEFRKLYNAALFNEWARKGTFNVHKSKRHGDGEECFGGGWFVVQATLPTGQITNHYKLIDWDMFKCEERERADQWDGHTAQDVAERLTKYLTTEATKLAETIQKKEIKHIKNIISTHNARILNEFQLQGTPDMPIIAYDERVCLVPAIVTATEETLKALTHKK